MRYQSMANDSARWDGYRPRAGDIIEERVAELVEPELASWLHG